MSLIELLLIAIYVTSIPFSFRAMVKDLKRDHSRKYLDLGDVIYCVALSLIPGINLMYVLLSIVSTDRVAQMRFFEDKE